MRRLRLSRTQSGSADPILCDGAPAVASASVVLGHLAAAGIPALAGFLAEPVMAEDRVSIDWYATIAGTAMPLPSLQGGDRVAAEERLQIRLAQLRAMAGATQDARLKALLDAAAIYPGPESVFVVGQEPVLTQWGSRALRTATAAPLPPAVVAGATARPSWLMRALLLTLLAVVILGLIGWAQRDRLTAWLGLNPSPESVASPLPPGLDLSQVAALQAEQARAEALRQEVAELRRAFEEKKRLCAAPPPPQPPPPTVPPVEQKTEIPVPPPQPPKPQKVEPKPKPPVPPKEPVPQVAAVPPPPEPQPQQACAAAIQERKSWDAPEVVFVIDSSGSMGEDAGGETRLSAAKESVAVIADNLPADVDTALVKFTNCNAIDNDYFLSRPELKQKVNALSPEGGTPLARSIERAANILSRKKDTVMVVVTDGEDSCHQKDPCQVAAAAKASHPKLTINVVDVSGNGLGSCIAQAGGGRTLPARTPAEIKLAMQQATYPHTLPSACKGSR